MSKVNHRHTKNSTACSDDIRKSKHRKKTGPYAPFLQTTKRLYDVEDDERHQNYREAYLEQWMGRIASESTAADNEYFKFTLNPPSEDFMRVPQEGKSFVYIPEQHLQWMWREGRLNKNPVDVLNDRLPKHTTNSQFQPKHTTNSQFQPKQPKRISEPSGSKYVFDNGIYKILIP